MVPVLFIFSNKSTQREIDLKGMERATQEDVLKRIEVRENRLMQRGAKIGYRCGWQ